MGSRPMSLKAEKAEEEVSLGESTVTNSESEVKIHRQATRKSNPSEHVVEAQNDPPVNFKTSNVYDQESFVAHFDARPRSGNSASDTAHFDIYEITGLLIASKYLEIIQVFPAILDKIQCTDSTALPHFVDRMVFFNLSNFKSAEQGGRASKEVTDTWSNSNGLSLFYLDKAKHQCIAVPTINVQKSEVGYDTKEVSVYSYSDSVRSSCQLVKHGVLEVEFDEDKHIDSSAAHGTKHHDTKLKKTGRKTVTAHPKKSRFREFNIRNSVNRPFERLGKAKERHGSKVAHSKSKIAQETQPGASVLDFSRKRSSYNVLSDHKPSDDRDGFYRKSGAFDKSNFRAAGQIPVSMLRERFLGLSAKRSANRTSSSTSSNSASFIPSRTRSADDSIRHHPDVCVVRHAFDTTITTQLLHASDYSKITQQLEPVPRDIPADSLISLLFILGVSYFKMSRYENARENFKQCEAVAKRVNRDGDVMLCNAYLGDMEYASQKYVEATNYYKTAIRHYTYGCVAVMFKLTPPTISAIHAKLASSYRNASMMVQAIHHYKKAIEVAQVDRDRLSAHTSLGNLYQSMGDNSNALAEYKQSIELANKLSDRVSLGWAHGNIGNAYLGLNRKDEAVHHLQKSLDLAVEYEQTPQAIGRTYNNLGTAYQSRNNLDKAEEYYDLALSQAVYGNDIAGQARVYGNIGNVHMLRKNYERAIPHYSEVLRLSSDPATISTARHNRGCAYYEWATSLLDKSQKTGQAKCTFHGPECDVDTCLSTIPRKALDFYQKGCVDLREVVKYHEERLQHIKGSPSGLTLSVSLFESNSRTFNRLQDCLVNLHRYEEALVVAEQSRARTLGELLLKRKRDMLSVTSPPLSFDQIVSILKRMECPLPKSQKSPLVYLSYTGARLLGWVITTNSDKYAMKTFEVPLDDDQFEGKSFDYYLRYSLNEKLVERSFEMYQSIKYDESSSSSVQILHSLVAAPIIKLLQDGNSGAQFDELILISDSYTSLLPLTCLFDTKGHSFFGDQYYLRSVPSLLTLGVMSQMPEVVVNVQEDQREFCIIGDPSILPFHQNGEIWTLGKLPNARREAEWVAHTLGTTPMLNEMATKSALLIRLMKAKVVHIATHGSASAGFLAFAAFMVHGGGSSRHVRGENVLLFPEDVEKLNISPALVVLSSCDSGRRTVEADGIQGMARAFILAGAQSVLTTLWKIPDESASVFMQFFYQYLIDEMKSTLALQKAILSVRCFAKYSQYIHWSGYQLTGRDIQFLSKPTRSFSLLKQRLGEPSIFPQLSTIKKLENALVNGPCLPTDVQLVKGCPGVNPAEIVVDFIFSFHKKFSGGIFWINCSVPELIKSCMDYVEKVTGTDVSSLPVNEVKQALFIFDNMTQLPELEGLLRILKSSHVHIIVLSTRIEAPDKLIKEIDRKLVRGTFIHNIAPLTMIHSTQRIVHSLLKKVNVTPANADQEMFEKLAEFTAGSPVVVEIASEVVLSCYNHCKNNAVPHLCEMLAVDHKGVQTPSASPTTDNTVTKTFASSSDYKDIYKTASVYDSWDSITTLLEECNLSPEERLLLNCLSIFGRNPMPFSLVTQMSSLITQTIQKVHLATTLHRKLLKFKLLKRYPLPVVLHSLVLERSKSELPQDLEYVYVPQQVSRCLWNSMEDVDKVAVFNIAYLTLKLLLHQSNDLCGLCSLLLELFEENYSLVGEQCYRQMYSLFLNFK